MFEIGQVNTLQIHEKTQEGYKLRAENFDVDVLLPQSEINGELELGSELKVFVYVDKSETPIASLKIPQAVVGEFAVLKALEVHQFGSFLAWGIQKDLFVPDTEQKDPLGEGQFYIVRVCIDETTHKVYGTTKIGKYIQASEFDISAEEQVDVIPAKNEELGYRCLINKKFIGMIYHNEIFRSIEIGKPLKAFVKKIRPDGLVDLALQVQGIKNIVNSQDKILAFLEACGGESDLHDKSSPEAIRSALNMSKKTFKSSLGMLYREKKILILKDGIKLL